MSASERPAQVTIEDLTANRPPIGAPVAFHLGHGNWVPATVESYGATETIYGPKPYLMLRYHPTLAASAYLDEEGQAWKREPPPSEGAAQ